MEAAQKPDGRGGARPGAGRPPGSKATLSASQVAELLEMAKERAATEKKTVAGVILDFVYDASVPKKDRLAACKLWMDLTIVKISEGSDGDKELGPAVFLPAHHPRLSVVKTDAA